MVIIAGIVWGGFLMIVVTALRKESRKAQRGSYPTQHTLRGDP